MILRIDPAGNIHTVYGEVIDLGALGSISIRRASSVEPDQQGRWWADLALSGGPILGPYSQRSHALAAEHRWLIDSWLASTTLQSQEVSCPNSPSSLPATVRN